MGYGKGVGDIGRGYGIWKGRGDIGRGCGIWEGSGGYRKGVGNMGRGRQAMFRVILISKSTR